jgi:hypothetical protein
MDEAVRGLLQDALQDLLSLEVALFFHNHPELVESREGLVYRMACEPERLAGTLQHLTEQGIVERFLLGGGRYEVFSYTPDRNRRSCIGKLSNYYHNDPIARKEIIRHIMARGRPARRRGSPPPAV